MNGIDVKYGLTTPDEQEALIKDNAMRLSNESFVVDIVPPKNSYCAVNASFTCCNPCLDVMIRVLSCTGDNAMRLSNESFVVVDETKFNQVYFARVPVQDNTRIITSKQGLQHVKFNPSILKSSTNMT
jgi:DeoR family fructose operon transcriptional repressor